MAYLRIGRTLEGAVSQAELDARVSAATTAAQGVGTGNAVAFTTVDASTDFTVGGTVITDNTITDDGTLVIASTTATSFSEGNITNVGDIAVDTITADGSSITFNDVIKGSANNTDITGTIDPAASTTVPGGSTVFTTEAKIGDKLVLHQGLTGTPAEEARIITAIASDTSLTVNAAFTNQAQDDTPEIHPASFVVTDDSNGIDFLIDTDGNIETSTTGKVYSKGNCVQSSFHSSLVFGY